MLEVITWKWKPRTPYRSTFLGKHVNILRNMVARNLSLPHRFSCITDDPTGIDSDIRVIPLWDTYANIPNPSNPRNPSCYRRLKMFSPEAKDLLGERIVSFDLDMVITGDLTPLFSRSEDFIIWGGQMIDPRGRKQVYCWYNGSMMMLKAGSRPQVWEKFDPQRSPQEANRANSRGSDQGWISYVLGQNEAVWTESDGVYSFRSSIVPSRRGLPSNARVVAFHGNADPWDAKVQSFHPWIREFYW